METVHGVRIPDSAFAREAEAFMEEHCPEFLGRHCRRTYAFGALAADRLGVAFREELAYAAALLHDLGLVEHHVDGRRFEVAGADVARAWARGQGLSADEAQVIWNAIALHTSLGIADAQAPESAVVFWGAAIDVAGMGPELPDGAADAVHRVLPRDGFAGDFAELIERRATREPQAYAQTWLAATAERCCGTSLPTSEHVLRVDPFLA
ncbi:HD domain-containing protein [Conexibacter sp. SYSU D00693]|uniref:HD domain-containing protein n=1 Tax=Conexibacter sp. SYSU D00693 TaxID=2812560 RepID=UPI00196B0AC5|nr:HD domain-containing protein [Conexibacter sp. SYSU D00693]